MTRRLIAAACLSFVVMLPLAASAQVVHRIDGTSASGQLVVIRDGQLVIKTSPGDAEVSIPLPDIDEVSFRGTTPKTHPATTAPVKTTAARHPTTTPATQPTTTLFHLKLQRGQQLHLSLTSWTDGKLSGTFGRNGMSIDVPVDAIEEGWCGSPDKTQAAKALGEKAGAEDIAFAARDDQVLAVHGVANGIVHGALKFKFNEAERSIGLNRLVGVLFAKSAAAAGPTAGLRQIITLVTGDSLAGNWTAVDDATIDFVTTWGQLVRFPIQDVVRIKSENGRAVSLSDLTPTSVEETPYFDRVMHWQIDRSLTGKPLMLADGPCARGIAVHSRSILTYTLNGDFAEFRSKVGFQQPEGRLGDAIIRVQGDGNTLYEKLDARGDQPPIDLKLKIAGVKQLTLEVDFGNGQDVGDQVVWGNAQLLRSEHP